MSTKTKAPVKKTPKVTAKKTSVKKKPVKQKSKKQIIKVIDHYADSKEVATEQTKLKELQKSGKEIENKIKEIISTFNSKSSMNKDAERFLERLPLDSLKDFSEFGKKRESSMEILKLRTKLRKDKEIKEVELNAIESQISVSKIDLLLAKINHLIKKPTASE
jgi:hypothetical protein